MTISIDWANRAVYIPKADLTLLQSSPIEIRELDLNSFRLILKELEASEAGEPFPDVHRHAAPVSVGGIILARVVEIINGYTVEFEAGNYAVNLAGGNSNLADRLILNQTSVRSANSAGLVQTRELEQGAFDGVIHIHTAEGNVGTIYPMGTLRAPVNNLADALLISELRGIDTFHVHSHGAGLIVDVDVSHKTFLGHSPLHSIVDVAPGVDTSGCVFERVLLRGELSGSAIIQECIVDGVSGLNGFVDRCILKGTVKAASAADLSIISCFDGVNPGSAILDCNGANSSIEVRDYYGGLTIANKTGADELTINFSAGRLSIADTVTGGTIVVRGVGEISSNLGSAAVNKSGLVGASEGDLDMRDMMRLMLSMLSGKVSGAGTGTEHFRDGADSKDRVVVTVDSQGNRTAVTLDPS